MKKMHGKSKRILDDWNGILLLVGAIGWLVLGSTYASADVLAANRGCLLPNCHGDPGGHRTLEDGTVESVKVDVDTLLRSAHKERKCVECHTDIDQIPHPSKLEPVHCERCHYEANPLHAPFHNQWREYTESIHGRKAAEGDPNAPRCSTCHGKHNIFGPSEPESSVNRAHIPDTCGQCHPSEEKDYLRSVHGTDLTQGNGDVPTCTNCHGVHNILPPSDPESSVSPGHVPETCGTCHGAVELARKYNFSVARVQTYEGSFHGLATRYSVTAVANCASCHGTHLVLPEDDPESTIYPANRQKTCAREECHPKARTEFASGQVHLGVADPPPTVVRIVQKVYILLIVATIGGMLVHNLLDLRAQLKLRRIASKTDERNDT